MMNIKTAQIDGENLLEQYRPSDPNHKWELVASGRWSESPYHSGYIAYYLAKVGDGTWVLNSLERVADIPVFLRIAGSPAYADAVHADARHRIVGEHNALPPLLPGVAIDLRSRIDPVRADMKMGRCEAVADD